MFFILSEYTRIYTLFKQLKHKDYALSYYTSSKIVLVNAADAKQINSLSSVEDLEKKQLQKAIRGFFPMPMEAMSIFKLLLLPTITVKNKIGEFTHEFIKQRGIEKKQ